MAFFSGLFFSLLLFFFCFVILHPRQWSVPIDVSRLATHLHVTQTRRHAMPAGLVHASTSFQIHVGRCRHSSGLGAQIAKGAPAVHSQQNWTSVQLAVHQFRRRSRNRSAGRTRESEAGCDTRRLWSTASPCRVSKSN